MPEQSAVVVEAIAFLMREDWYKVGSLLRHLELAFPAEYEAARQPWLEEKSQYDGVVRALEAERHAHRELRHYVDSDAHHEMATVAGILRLHDNPRVVELGDQLSEACKRGREALGVCRDCGGARMLGGDPCPTCAVTPPEAPR